MAFFFGFGYDKEGYDKKGFNKQGYNRAGYDKEGYNEDGYNAEGYDRLGFNADGYSKSGFNKEGYDREGFDWEGFDVTGYDRTGKDRDGFDRAGYNSDGYDRDGYNKQGFDIHGYDRDGYDLTGYNVEGYNRQGYDKKGYNKSGFDAEGYNSAGYDADWFDREGYDPAGFNRAGYNRKGYDVSGYDVDGFDCHGYDAHGYDREGYNCQGLDKNGFDKDGYSLFRIAQKQESKIEETQRCPFLSLYKVYDTVVVFDVETSGLDPRKDQIVELAAEKICFSDDKLKGKPYRCLVQLYGGRRMSEDVTRINHITNDMLQNNGISINDVIDQFVDFVGTSKCLLVAHNASFDMGFLEQAMIKCNKTLVLRGWDALDTLTVFKDRHPYPHKLANAISVYQLDNIAVNSHSAYDDTMALTQVLLKMAIERDDLLRYVNLFGFNPKYPPKYLVEGIKYIAQSYDRKRTLYEEVDSKRKNREAQETVQKIIIEQNKHERLKAEKTITDIGTILTCPDCNGKVSKRADRCPHCGCPISYVLQNASKNPHNFMAKPNGQMTQREEKEKTVINKSEGDIVKELIGETISYGGFGKCVITQIDDGRITFNCNDGKEYRVRMKDFERYGNFDSAEKADKFYKIFGETIQKQKEFTEKKPIVPYFDIFAENNSCGEYENEIDERMDDNYYIGDGDDWDEYY